MTPISFFELIYLSFLWLFSIKTRNIKIYLCFYFRHIILVYTLDLDEDCGEKSANRQILCSKLYPACRVECSLWGSPRRSSQNHALFRGFLNLQSIIHIILPGRVHGAPLVSETSIKPLIIIVTPWRSANFTNVMASLLISLMETTMNMHYILKQKIISRKAELKNIECAENNL